MSNDIRRMMQAWPDDDPVVRRITGDDGRPVIQRRLSLGILQFEENGRPDGLRPFGFDSYYDYLITRKSQSAFQLGHDDCQELAAEALLYYQRRLCYFELGDYVRAARDAERNLDVFEFVRKYAVDDDDRCSLDQYRAFVICHRARALALDAVQRADFTVALRAIEEGVRGIITFLKDYGMEELVDESEEIHQLRELRTRIEGMRPTTPVERLRKKLQDAIRGEKYELAAKLRDRIRHLE